MRIVALILVFFLFSCGHTPPASQYPAFDFGPAEPLNVSSIEYIDAFKPSFAAPNVEHTFPVKPYSAVQSLINSRIQAVGTANNLRVTLLDASVMETPLPRTKGVEGVFTADQSEQYSGNIEVLLEVFEPGHALPKAKLNVHVTRSATVPERISLREREDFYYDFTKAMMQQVDKELTTGIMQYFAKYRMGAAAVGNASPSSYPALAPAGGSDITSTPLPPPGQ